ncbi:MAG: cytochrome c biogenesis protein ResB [Chloroflexota bacterium]|nr:cytochrome c biogenesis protein ResB [Chloroflexota bacterium]
MALDRLWWFFTSVRVALWLIGTTIGWVLLATLAQSTFPSWIAQRWPVVTGATRWWNNWSVWDSPPFRITLILLTISIICGGMVNRAPGIVRRVWHPALRTSPGFFAAVKQVDAFTVPSVVHGVEGFTTALKRRRYRVLTHRDARSDAFHLYGDKNRFSLLATFPFHTGLVLLMVGAYIVGTYGWREIGFTIPDGSTRTVGHGTGLTVKSIRFVDDYYSDGRPRDYYSDLELYMGGNVVKAGRLRVNDPINIGGISFHQASYGQAAKFLIADAATGKTVWDDSIPVFVSSNKQFARNFRDAAGELEPTGVQRLDDLGVTLRLVGSAGASDEKIGVGQMAIAIFDNRTVKVGAGPIGTGKLDPSGTLTFGGLNFTYQREVRFTALQITDAPGLWIIYLAAAIIFFSTLVTFYIPQRRVRALVTPQPDGTTLMRIGAQVKLDIFGAREFEQLRDAIKARVQAARDRSAPDAAIADARQEPVGAAHD